MTIMLWVLQGVLAAAFLLLGVMKSTQSREKLRPTMPWVQSVPTTVLRIIGVSEFAAAVGLILPPLLDVAPVLAAWAATGLAVTMVLAAALHIHRKEPQAIIVNAVILVLAAIVAWGRSAPRRSEAIAAPARHGHR